MDIKGRIQIQIYLVWKKMANRNTNIFGLKKRENTNTNTNFWTGIRNYEYNYKYSSHTDSRTLYSRPTWFGVCGLKFPGHLNFIVCFSKNKPYVIRTQFLWHLKVAPSHTFLCQHFHFKHVLILVFCMSLDYRWSPVTSSVTWKNNLFTL